MKKIIYFVYAWKGPKADVKLIYKYWHLYKMSQNIGRKKFRLVPEKKGEITKLI